MHDCLVKMKDGTTWCGPINLFRPKEGWMSLMGEDAQEKLFFRDMLSAVTKGERVCVSKIGDQDEIARARNDGWDGK